MKKVVSISLGSSEQDFNFRTRFLGQDFKVVRLGTDKDTRAARKLISEWQSDVNVVGLGMVPDHYCVGTNHFNQEITRKLEKVVAGKPVTTGARLREIVQEWSLRSAQIELSNFFNNAKVLFLSGTTNYRMASVMAEYTQNLSFADPVLQFGAPGMLHSLSALEMYAAGSHPILKLAGGKTRLPSLAPGKYLNKMILRRAIQDADVIVATYDQLQRFTAKDLADKAVLTSTISPERLATLKEKGVRLVIDCSIQPFEETVGLNVIEAMIIAALDKQPEEILHDDYLEIFTDLQLQPRILYPIEGKKANQPFCFRHSPPVAEVPQQCKAAGDDFQGFTTGSHEYGRESGRLLTTLCLLNSRGCPITQRRRGQGLADYRRRNTEGDHVAQSGVYLPTAAGSGRYGEEDGRTNHGTGRVHQGGGRRRSHRCQTRAPADYNRQQL